MGGGCPGEDNTDGSEMTRCVYHLQHFCGLY